jgi:hypothetical protein
MSNQHTLEDLKVKAAFKCIAIYEDFSEEEIKEQPPSIQKAWEVGKTIKEVA